MIDANDMTITNLWLFIRPISLVPEMLVLLQRPHVMIVASSWLMSPVIHAFFFARKVRRDADQKLDVMILYKYRYFLINRLTWLVATNSVNGTPS